MDNKHPLLTSACEYIEINLHLKISMLDLKRHTNYSERSLQLIFKKYLNKSPFEYIEEQRLLKAHELIKQHKQSKKTTHIATEVGFRHLGRFSVNFKKRFGIHPSVLARS
ncbi:MULTISPECIES: helix-turn-helix transcriptional regulator [Candidatus Methylopumilus]|uniref:helix-turn-helix transcriptional regulator n=1 Tax=Candidatus Methylopumilus TaxID=1679002 RepID=UPI001120E016|nr:MULTISPECIES: helix-turn-helix transcriptional regulator [Methylopumilus]QDC96182.1 helix-turn-helix transcriptional regulator [Candidatus Methylopumilus universalis]QDD10706.1 helix-turn-helix transcriptional regulator [Candidatus Methylopumilus planktonicus]QDD23175.1 helix-turn-helix transcriptional regulator [Candidatus Methylopumilus planktonicus]